MVLLSSFNIVAEFILAGECSSLFRTIQGRKASRKAWLDDKLSFSSYLSSHKSPPKEFEAPGSEVIVVFLTLRSQRILTRTQGDRFVLVAISDCSWDGRLVSTTKTKRQGLTTYKYYSNASPSQSPVLLSGSKSIQSQGKTEVSAAGATNAMVLLGEGSCGWFWSGATGNKHLESGTRGI